MRRASVVRDGGFTLLEMMVALGILAIALTWLVEATTRAIEAENHAKLMTTATFLARQKLVEAESEIRIKGLQEEGFASETTADFEEPVFKRFKCSVLPEKVKLPSTADMQTATGNAATGGSGSGAGDALGGLSGILGGMGGGAGNSGSGTSGSGGAFGGMGGSAGLLSSQYGSIKDVLEQAIRKYTVTCVWTEHGTEKSIMVSTYFTDPNKLQVGGQAPPQK